VVAIVPEKLAFGNRFATLFKETENNMKLMVALMLPTHRWIGPMNTLPRDAFDQNRLTLGAPLQGTLLRSIRIGFVRHVTLRSQSMDGLTLLCYRLSVKVSEPALVALDCRLATNRLWCRYESYYEPKVGTLHQIH